MILLPPKTSLRAGAAATKQMIEMPRHYYLYSSSSISPRAKTPFYGAPRPQSSRSSLLSRISLTIHSATTAFADPTRADAVAKLGELTGPRNLSRMLNVMNSDPTGRLILKERPVVSKETIPFQQLIENAAAPSKHFSDITFGQAYGGMSSPT
jgi:hypothetical protein